jgi:enamine deaminase RidA (YjgF/YER057c/UK114 family)
MNVHCQIKCLSIFVLPFAHYLPAFLQNTKMSGLQFFAYPGQGEVLRSQLWYSQSVRVGDRIEISGQGTTSPFFPFYPVLPNLPIQTSRLSLTLTGGWDPKNGAMKTSLLEELDQAFSNVDLALRDAGGKGWEQVYKVTMYIVESVMHDEEFLGRAIENLKKWAPNHQHLLTAVGVAKLGAGDSAGMRVEIEVVAYDPRE